MPSSPPTARSNQAASSPAEATGARTTGVPETSAPTTSLPETSAPTSSAPDEPVVSSGEETAGLPALTLSQPHVDRFFSVGVTWRNDPSMTDVTARIRVKDVHGAWGEWTDLQADDIEQTVTAETKDSDVRSGTAPYWTGEGHGIQAIVQGAGGAVPEDVKVTLLDPAAARPTVCRR